ncbi:Wzz/FepE/Etk N-terminal domain-containing protein [Malaciobacter mytili]|uniref:Wzz/FepE/Etk N-terminal domain-containing protein n=1 Tax=Malaciobacter mytili TaxID=603050 RepID=UPI003A893B35
MQIENKQIQENEINLTDLILILWKNRVFIILFTVFLTIVATLYAYTKTPIFEARGVVKIGKYIENNVEKQIEESNILSAELNILFIDLLKNNKQLISKIESIRLLKKQKEYIEIVSLSISNDLAKKEINKVITFIKEKHSKVLNEVLKTKELEIKNINTEINNLKNNKIHFLEEKIKYLTSNLLVFEEELKKLNQTLVKIENENISFATLNLIQKRDLIKIINDLKLQIYDLKNEKNNIETVKLNELLEAKNKLEFLLLPHNYNNTEIVGDILIYDFPLKPKTKLIIAIGFVTSFILSIFLVFFIEFIKNLRNLKKEKINE